LSGFPLHLPFGRCPLDAIPFTLARGAFVLYEVLKLNFDTSGVFFPNKRLATECGAGQ